MITYCFVMFFREVVPVISPEITTKQVFRAINMGDKIALQEMLNRTEGVYNVSLPFFIL